MEEVNTKFVISLLIFGLSCPLALAQSLTEQARTKIDQAEAKREALQGAMARQDTVQLKSLRDEMRQLAREGQAMFKEAGVEESGDAALLREYAEALELAEDYDLAAGAYRAALESDPQDATLWLKLGSAEARVGEARMTETKHAFERCLQLVPDERVAADAYAGLGELYWGLGLFDISRAYYEQVLTRAMDHVPTIVALAALHAREGEVVTASGALDALGAALGRYSGLLEERLTKAMNDFDRNRVWFADTAENHVAYAKLLFRVGRLPESVLVLERSLDLDDRNYVAWNLLGSFSGRTGDTDRARAAYERSLALNPNQPRTREAINALNEDPQ